MPGITKPVATATREKRTLRDYLVEPSTWMGILSIVATISTSGATTFTNPASVSALAAGQGLILAKEERK